eukprot:TRINITY_DN17061_c0_g1_i2.p1 TRINITY_DN17061_c0_g1~~TRINITY_DN17061_c0_g1_i2.p1  ORF type:complete len:194 (-),score=21.26 TRINITY_DN17061_c0_g1_i2:310-891(-)
MAISDSALVSGSSIFSAAPKTALTRLLPSSSKPSSAKKPNIVRTLQHVPMCTSSSDSERESWRARSRVMATSAALAAGLALSLASTAPVALGELSAQEEVFQRTCAGCHAGGGNILQPSATLSLQDLARNGIDSEEGVFNITYSGKNRMPGYGEECQPRGQCTFGPRLSKEEIRQLAEFVYRKAEQGWASSPL